MRSLYVAVPAVMILVLLQTFNTEAVDILRLLEARGVTKCTISLHCLDPQQICVHHKCRKNVPCNKDNDCFFWGAADVANKRPHPKCYIITVDSPVAPEYGICIISEYVGKVANTERLSGDDADHLDVNPI